MSDEFSGEIGPIRYTLPKGASVRRVASKPVLRGGRLLWTEYTVTVSVPVEAAGEFVGPPAPEPASPWEQVQPGVWRHKETHAARFQEQRPE